MTPSKAPLRFLGAWQMTKCESSHPDLTYPKSKPATFTLQADVVKYENETVWSDGRKSSATGALPLDGSWSQMNGSDLSDSASLHVAGDSGFSVFLRKDGVDAGSCSATVSATGRVLTERWQIKRPDGATITWSITSERR